jgi:hypothetical protein
MGSMRTKPLARIGSWSVFLMILQQCPRVRNSLLCASDSVPLAVAPSVLLRRQVPIRGWGHNMPQLSQTVKLQAHDNLCGSCVTRKKRNIPRHQSYVEIYISNIEGTLPISYYDVFRQFIPSRPFLYLG